MGYYRRRYKRNKNSYDRDEFNLIDGVFEVFLKIIFYLGTWLGRLIFRLVMRLFSKGVDMVNSFKMNEDISYPIQINKNTDTIDETPETTPITVTKTIQNSADQEESNYAVKNFLTPAESEFLLVLEKVIGDRYEIEKQVQLSRIATPKDSNKNFTNYHYFNKIKAKSIDFVLFDKTKNYKPYLCIELDDHSHLRWDRIKRDEFVNGVMKDINLRIIHVPVRRFYNTEKLRQLIFVK